MPIWTIKKTFCFLSAVRISQKSDRNQSCTQDPFQHEIIKLSSSFTSSLGSCRLLMMVSLSISKRSSNLWQKRQYVSTFLLVNNVSSFYQTISSLDMDLSQYIQRVVVQWESSIGRWWDLPQVELDKALWKRSGSSRCFYGNISMQITIKKPVFRSNESFEFWFCHSE